MHLFHTKITFICANTNFFASTYTSQCNKINASLIINHSNSRSECSTSIKVYIVIFGILCQ